jgi:hypothetical protein
VTGEQEPTEPSDPTILRTVAVRSDDAITALESNLRGPDARTILRVTPPFHGRMRARIHRLQRDTAETGDDGPDRADGPASDARSDVDSPAGTGRVERTAAGALHVPPATLFESPLPYPSVDDTADALRRRGAYDPDRHRDRHERSVSGWRRAIRDCRAGSVAIPTPDGTHEVAVVWLG